MPGIQVFGISFSQSQNLGYFLLIGVVFLLVWNTTIFRKKMLKLWGLNPDHSNLEGAFLQPQNRKYKTVFYLVGLVFVGLSVLGPQWGEKTQTLRSEGLDMCIALDLSQSMLADDLLPSRLKAAKSQLSYFLPRLGGDRLALVGFAGTSFIAAPLTPDISALLSFLEPLDPDYISDPSTQITSGVEGCLEALKLDQVSSREEIFEEVSQIIFLVTDGEDRDPEGPSIEKAAKLGVPILSIAVGTSQGARIPTRNDRGEIVNYIKRPRTGEYVVTKLEDAALKAMASRTNGKVFYLSEGNSVWEEVEDYLRGFKRRSREAGQQVDLEQRFQWPLLIGFLLLLLDFFLPELKFSQGTRKIKKSILMVFLFLGSMTAQADSNNPYNVYWNRQALKDFDLKDLQKSYDHLKKALSEDANDELTRANFLTHSLLRAYTETTKEAAKNSLIPVVKECLQLLKTLGQQTHKGLSSLRSLVQFQCALAQELDGNIPEALKLHYLNYDAPPEVRDLQEKAKKNVIRLLQKQEQQKKSQGDKSEDSKGSGEPSSGNKGDKEKDDPTKEKPDQKFSEGDKDRKTKRPFKDSELSEQEARKILESVSGEESAVKKRKTQNEQRLENQQKGQVKRGFSGDPW